MDDDEDDETTQTSTTVSKEEKTTSSTSSAKADSSKNKSKTMDRSDEQQASTSKKKADDDRMEDKNADDDADEEVDTREEYNVKAIRGERKNKSGVDEYHLKWEGYSESASTLEPLENLKCPELISKYNEQEANKRRHKKAERIGSASRSATKRPRRDAMLAASGSSTQDNHADQATKNGLFVEDNEDDDESDIHTETNRKKSKGQSKEQASELIGPKGFDRKLPVEKISRASIGDDDKLYFPLKWQGRSGIELVFVVTRICCKNYCALTLFFTH